LLFGGGGIPDTGLRRGREREAGEEMEGGKKKERKGK
jgi:hypothetical protein